MQSASRSPRALFYTGLGALAVAAALFAVTSRLHHSLTVDEPFMANTVRLPWSDMVGVFPGDNIPFAYLLLKGWTALFGEAEWALRSLSVLAYSAAVVMTGLAGRRVAGSAAGLMAATLMATSTKMGIVYAATARPYALLALVASLALLQSLILTQPPVRGSRRAATAALALTHLLGLLTHPAYVFVLLAYGAASAVVRRTAANAATVAAAIALAAYVAVWGPVLRATVAIQGTSWMTPVRAVDLKAACLLLWGTGPGMMMVGALVALTLASIVRTRDAISTTGIRWSLIAVGVAWAAPIAASFLKPVFLASRTPVMLLPVTAVLLGSLLGALAGRLAVATLAALFLLAGSQVLPAAREPDPFPTRDSLATVLRQAACGDTIVAAGLANAPIEYYLRRLGAPSCVRYVSFPADMANWAGRITQPETAERVRREGRDLAGVMLSRRGTVWVFGSSRGWASETYATLEEELEGVLSCAAPLPLRGAYFDRVLVCRPPSRPDS